MQYNMFITSDWNTYLDRFPLNRKDIYFTEGYVKLYENGVNKAVCFVYEEESQLMIFPYLVRTFLFEGKEYRDFETAYGYGGPLYSTDNKDFQQRSLKSMFAFMQSERYIAGLVRFHTLLGNYQNFCIGNLIKDRKTIGIDLSLSEDEIWKQEIHSKNRNMIKKAEKNGLEFHVDDDFKTVKNFIQLYDQTMDKLSAENFYYFANNYYDKLKENIPESFIGEVTKDGQIISAAIFMQSGEYGHYHLSGSDKSMLAYSPNNFMLWNAALELKKRGVKTFHLGGGTTSSEDDSLFLFKSRFSKHTYDFYIATIVFNDNIYQEILDEWVAKNPEKANIFGKRVLRYKY